MTVLLPLSRSCTVGPAPLRPLRRRGEASGEAPISIRIAGAFTAEVAAAASDLTTKAFGIGIEIDAAAPDVVAIEGAVDAPRAAGADPRPGGRAGLDEAHIIRVRDGRLAVTTPSAEGLFRALVTIAGHSASGVVPAAEIVDHPDRAWRGLTLDVVRRWFPLDEVRRIIDLLALHKMNVLHLHLTDTQAWRFALPGYPGLHSAEHYTAADLDALEQYARARFVVIVPEVDVPGHVPESLTALDTVSAHTGAHPILAYLDAAAPGVSTLIEAAFGELADRFASPFLHFGADEAFGAPDDAFRRTVEAAARSIRSLGRTPTGWQEGIRAGALGPGDLVQLWIAERDRFDPEKMKRITPPEYHAMIDRGAEIFALSADDPARIGAAGVPAIISSSDPLYLDRRPSEPSVLPEQNEAGARLGNDGYDPTPSTSVLDWRPEDQADIRAAGVRVAGIEAALWGETLKSFDDAAQLLLPRLAFIAQQAWAPAARDDVIAAAAAHSEVWTRLGFGNHYRSADIF